jgi:hypothetical protein
MILRGSEVGSSSWTGADGATLPVWLERTMTALQVCLGSQDMTFRDIPTVMAMAVIIGDFYGMRNILYMGCLVSTYNWYFGP